MTFGTGGGCLPTLPMAIQELCGKYNAEIHAAVEQAIITAQTFHLEPRLAVIVPDDGYVKVGFKVNETDQIYMLHVYGSPPNRVVAQ